MIKNPFRTKISIQGRIQTFYSIDAPKGSGYCEEQIKSNILVKEYFFLHFCFRTRILEEEIVPNWAWIQSATLGYTEWKTKLKVPA